MTAQGIKDEYLLGHRGKSVERPAHVVGRRGQVDPDRRRQSQHEELSRISTTFARNELDLNREPNRIECPLRRSISISDPRGSSRPGREETPAPTTLTGVIACGTLVPSDPVPAYSCDDRLIR